MPCLRTIIGLDLGKTTGVCVIDLSGQWRVFSISSKAKDIVDAAVEVGERLRHAIEDIDGRDPFVGIEDLSYGYAGKRRSLVQMSEFRGLIRYFLKQWGMEHGFVPVTRARCFLLGKGYGGVKKADLQRRLESQGFTFADDNMMDAFVVALYFDKVLNGRRLVEVRYQPELFEGE